MKWRLLAVACVLLALGLLLYPLMGELVSEKYHSDVEAVYTAAIADTDNAELAEQRRAAEAYNALLRGEAAVCTGGASASPVDYAEQLTVGGAMCTIDIPKIGVYLPVRHGTGAETLERAVGHVVGTSLPVGGVGTHAVLSAHSGMASAKLFSDIDQLAEGESACETCGVKLLTASGSVNGDAVDMENGNAIVPLTVINNPGFDLPKTGGYGTWMFTVGGCMLLGVAAFIVVRGRKHNRNDQ